MSSDDPLFPMRWNVRSSLKKLHMNTDETKVVAGRNENALGEPRLRRPDRSEVPEPRQAAVVNLRFVPIEGGDWVIGPHFGAYTPPSPW